MPVIHPTYPESVVFRTLVVDPPWPFKDQLSRKNRGAGAHYDTLGMTEIWDYPMPPMTQDCWLLLWRVAAMVPEAYETVKRWGFTAKSELVWRKLTRKGNPHFGMGRSFRAAHESCIVATRGSPKPLSRSVRTIFTTENGEAAEEELGSIFSARGSGVHSEKPNDFYHIIEKVCEGPYCELFARQQRDKWFCHGIELKSSHAWSAPAPVSI